MMRMAGWAEAGSIPTMLRIRAVSGSRARRSKTRLKRESEWRLLASPRHVAGATALERSGPTALFSGGSHAGVRCSADIVADRYAQIDFSTGHLRRRRREGLRATHEIECRLVERARARA